jgi:hypothetical protein
MRLEPRHNRPMELLRSVPAKVFEQLEAFRARKGQAPIPDWPSWCYLPIAAGYAVATQGSPVEELTLEQRIMGGQYASRYTGLAAWRITKGIWDIDSDLARELWDTPLEGRLPADALFRMPEWCVYICIPEGLASSELMGRTSGFFAWLEADANGHGNELRFLLDRPGADLLDLVPLGLHLTRPTIDECVEEFLREARAQAAEIGAYDAAQMGAAGEMLHALLPHLVSVVLYLCSSEPDLTRRLPPPPGSGRKVSPRPVRDPVLWPVGIRIGAALRAAVATPRESSEPGEPTGWQVRPHVRRAHWHAYWVGRRTEEQRGERLELRWVSPVLIGGDGAVATVRPVQ